MTYCYDDKYTFVELKLMVLNILCNVLNDEVYHKEKLIRDLEKLVRRLDAAEPNL
jgi:hypothetical protein